MKYRTEKIQRIKGMEKKLGLGERYLGWIWKRETLTNCSVTQVIGDSCTFKIRTVQKGGQICGGNLCCFCSCLTT